MPLFRRKFTVAQAVQLPEAISVTKEDGQIIDVEKHDYIVVEGTRLMFLSEDDFCEMYQEVLDGVRGEAQTP